MNVGELKARLAGLDDGMEVMLEVMCESSKGDDLMLAGLSLFTIESRCDDVECVYLWGDADDHS